MRIVKRRDKSKDKINFLILTFHDPYWVFLNLGQLCENITKSEKTVINSPKIMKILLTDKKLWGKELKIVRILLPVKKSLFNYVNHDKNEERVENCL